MKLSKFPLTFKIHHYNIVPDTMKRLSMSLNEANSISSYFTTTFGRFLDQKGEWKLDLLDSLFACRVSQHFSFAELTTTSHPVTANLPLVGHMSDAIYFARHVLEPLRELLGRPIYINSWFRSPVVNKLVGGVVGSYHTAARAADIPCTHAEKLVIEKWSTNHNIKCIDYPSFVHLQI